MLGNGIWAPWQEFDRDMLTRVPVGKRHTLAQSMTDPELYPKQSCRNIVEVKQNIGSPFDHNATDAKGSNSVHACYVQAGQIQKLPLQDQILYRIYGDQIRARLHLKACSCKGCNVSIPDNIGLGILHQALKSPSESFHTYHPISG